MIGDERALTAGRREAARLRREVTGCTVQAAERWARRHVRTVERIEPRSDVGTVEGQARTVERLARLFPDKVRDL